MIIKIIKCRLPGLWYHHDFINKKIKVENKPIFCDKIWYFKVKHCNLLIEINDCEDINKIKEKSI